MTQNEYKQQWERSLEIIMRSLEAKDFATWFSPLSFYSYNSQTNELKINAPSGYFREYIEKNFSIIMWEAVRHEFGLKVRICFRQVTDSENKLTQVVEVGNSKTLVEGAEPSAKAEKQINRQGRDVQPEFDSHLLEEYSFDNFIEGKSNILSRSVGMSLAQNPKQMTFNPLFIHGHSGVGKTHLVNAIGKAIKDIHPEKKVLYLSAHVFQYQYVDAVRNNNTPDFMRFYQQVDVLILDDVHEFAAQKGTQNTFFHIFNHLKQNGKQIILTCDRKPSEMQGMEERLLSRFKWGMIAEIGQPDEKLRRGILLDKIHRNGLNIPQDVVEYLSKNITGNARELEGVVNSLMAHSVCFNCEIDLPLAQRVLNQTAIVESRTVTVDDIVEHTCRVLEVSKEDILGSSRRANIAQARQIAMYLTQKNTNLSTSKIGALIGNRNHATVIHSVNLINDLLANDKKVQEKVSAVEESLKKRRN